MASHVSYALRVALIFHEVCRRIGTLDVVVGEPLDFAQMLRRICRQNTGRFSANPHP